MLLFALTFTACNNSSNQNGNNVDTLLLNDTIESGYKTLPDTSIPKIYNNEQFKDVTVEKIAKNTFKISGATNIKDSIVYWAIEDGHDELQNGSIKVNDNKKTFNEFSITVTATKKNSNSTLQLILFKKGKQKDSREFELPVVLY